MKSGIGEHVARFIASQRAPTGSAPEAKDNSSNTPAGWNTLEELRQVVTAKGCTKAQFDHAIEAVGRDPHRVATYLQRFAFKQATKTK